MSTIIGDVLLSSAFLAYAGYFDQHVSQYCLTMYPLSIKFHCYVHLILTDESKIIFNMGRKNSVGTLMNSDIKLTIKFRERLLAFSSYSFVFPSLLYNLKDLNIKTVVLPVVLYGRT
jgi:hypothetical protein